MTQLETCSRRQRTHSNSPAFIQEKITKKMRRWYANIGGNVSNDLLGSKFASRVIVQRALGRFPLGSTRHPLGGQAFTPPPSVLPNVSVAQGAWTQVTQSWLFSALIPPTPQLIHPPPSRPLSSLAITCHGFGRYDRNSRKMLHLTRK